jgi:hypothetical protein
VLNILASSASPAASCPAQARVIDFPHGQEKTSTQKEIREEIGEPKKENNHQEEERAEENRAK